MPLHQFHPAVANWFTKEFPEPTEIQSLAWPAIKKNQNTLIAAPTGSGKTLAAFLAAIDDLIRLGLEGNFPEQTQVVYVSPLKALSNDIERNLQRPLAGIEEELKALGLPEVKIKAVVRTGDTPAKDRTAMIKHPPQILVTTPESLYLLLTSESGRKMLANVHTLIVDEIHALVGNKRGSHLALSMERLQALTGRNLVRIGLSATQKPIEEVAKFLVGTTPLNPLPSLHSGQALIEEGNIGVVGCTIINTGHKRKLDLAIEVPRSPLGAVMSNEVWSEIYRRLEELIQEHRTTLIFVNTRRLAERAAFQLTDRLGADKVTAHHGSLSREKRLDAEQRLKSGALRALVATASLELGIDIGSVDLVCQIGSPKSIATFLQRVGRSGHTISGTPKGRLFPLSRDELVECCSIFDAVRRGELDRFVMPEKPLDILAQQIVAEVAAREYTEDELYHLICRAYPYRDLTRKEFDDVVKMLGEGFTTRRGRRGAYLHHDMVNQRIRGRKGARLASLTSGGAIPDSFDYDVILEPTNTFIGTVNEDFAFESMAGDIFQLGNSSWKITKIENGSVRVMDAKGAPPTIPFWLGEAPGRTAELSFAVSRLREEIDKRLGDEQPLPESSFNKANFSNLPTSVKEIPPIKGGEEGGVTGVTNAPAINWLVKEVGVELSAAEQVVMYLATAKAALGVLPTQTQIVMERFFDEVGDMHLVIHSPYGNRMNRAWGLSLRKRFCVKFNFELQAAATEDAIVLSLGPTHSFSLDEVYQYLNSNTVRDVLIQAMLISPMFEIRWRWNATRSLAMLRRRDGKKVPANIQRMNAQDLVALVFPDQIACAENVTYPIEIPDHPLVNQTVHDCLNEAMNIVELEKFLKKLEASEIIVIARDMKEPSLLSQEILNARPYAFLDDAPLEERRTRAVANRRWLDPAEAADLGKLDPAVIDAVREQAWPEAENADELHDALVLLGFMTVEEGLRPLLSSPLNKGLKPPLSPPFNKGGIRGVNWQAFFNELVSQNRATVLTTPGNKNELWVATERLPQLKAIYSPLTLTPAVNLPERFAGQVWTEEKALVEIVRGRLEGLGPVHSKNIAGSMGLPVSLIEQTLTALEVEGFVFRGKFTPGVEETEWCERRLLARIHRFTLDKLRKEIEPVSAADFMRFLFSWHRMEAAERPEGPDALQVILDQLEGFEAPAAAWESTILPARIADYDFSWLDMSCLSGKTVWGRFRPTKNGNGTKSSGPIKTTPIMLVSRTHLEKWKQISEMDQDFISQLSHPTRIIFEFLLQRGASFFHELAARSGLLQTQVEDAISELVALGLVTSDSFTGLRALLVPAKYKLRSTSERHHHKSLFNMDQAGRWSLLYESSPLIPPLARGGLRGSGNDAIELIARVLLRRYGVVFRKIAERENISPPWRELVRIYRTLEARGEIRGGRFVDGMWGEQFALPEAVTKLRAVKKEEKTGALISISAADPLNLQGIITPGRRITNFTANRILYRDGIPIAVNESGEVEFLTEFTESEKWKIQNMLIQQHVSPKLRAYLGKGIG